MTPIPQILLVAAGLRSMERLPDCLDRKRLALEAVGDLADAWSKLQALPSHYDVIVLGRMPRYSEEAGLLSCIQEKALVQGIPIIMQTRANSRVEMNAGLHAGAAYYLPEAFDAKLLARVLDMAAADRMRCRHMQQAPVMSGRAFAMLGEACFRFRTLGDARELATLLAEACPNPTRAVIGMTELLINAVEHGNLGISYAQKSRLLDKKAWEEEITRRLGAPGYAERQVRVRYRRTASSVQVVIADEGEGFDWRRYMDVAPERLCDNHGRGIALSRTLSFDDIEYRGRGNEVAVRIGIEAGAWSAGLG